MEKLRLLNLQSSNLFLCKERKERTLKAQGARKAKRGSKMINISDEMQRFLITTTFGYDLKSDDPCYIKLKKACSRRAYLDLARVVPYKFSVSQIDECKKKCEKEQEIKDFIESKGSFICCVEGLLINSRESECSKTTISNVCSCAAKYKDDVFKAPFTFGMAQKWVNMYYKYLWLFSDTQEFAAYLGIPEDLDMPIDSYIIDALFEEGILSEKICNNPSNHFLNCLITTSRKKVKSDKRPSESVLKWSGWDDNVYIAVQKLIKEKCKAENIHILKYENRLWMKQVIENEI